MAQGEILELLRKHKDKWFTNQEIASILGLSYKPVQYATMQMRKRNEILYKADPSRERYLNTKTILYKSKEW